MAKRTPRSEADDISTATPADREPRASSRAGEGRQPISSSRGRTGHAENSENATAVEETAPQSADTFAARPEPRDMESAGESRTADIGGGDAAPSDEEIRARAYEIYIERGGEHGMDFEDWLRAERELRQSRSR